MKFTKFLRDKFWEWFLAAFSLLVVCGMLLLFQAPAELIAAVALVWFLMLSGMAAVDYGRKYRFYRRLTQNLESLDQKYLVLELLEEPGFYEGKIIYQALYEIDKSMAENVRKYRRSIEDFKDYIEMWVHETKLPIASLQLMFHNNRDSLDAKYETQVRRLDRYMDQVLYYVRSENAHRDYLIKRVRLCDVVRRVAVKYKDDLLLSNISFSMDVPDSVEVTTDEKWMEFMLGQLLSNSIKYQRQGEESRIHISAEPGEDAVRLHVWDNGIGIPQTDLPRLFDKSFTGENGRLHAKSTGMGLYIVKQLCEKLGHKITVRSVRGAYTDAEILFGENDFYCVEAPDASLLDTAGFK